MATQFPTIERLLRPVEPEARSRDLTQAEKAQAFLEEQLAKITSRERARRLSMTAFGGSDSGIPGGMGAVDFVPFLGSAKGLEEGGRDIRQGNYDLESGRYGDAARNYGAAVLGVLPGAAGAVKVAPRFARAIKAAPQDEALRLASQRAKQIGQSENPLTRMLQQGYEDDWYHGTTGDIRKFDPSVLGESTGAPSAKKGYFFARDPSSPPSHMVQHDPESVALLEKAGVPIPPSPTVKGHGAYTASSYAGSGGSREYKTLMRKANSAEKSGNWDDYEKYMAQVEDLVTKDNNYRQLLVAKQGDARDVMLKKIEDAWYNNQDASKFKSMSREDLDAYDRLYKELMPHGWYASSMYQEPQFENLIGHISSVAKEKPAKEAIDSIKKYLSVRNEGALANVESGANVLPVALRYKNPMYHDFGGSSYRDESYSNLIDQALREGHDALILKNTYDPGGFGPTKMVDVGVVFDPDQIRSRFAAFDPFRKDVATAAAFGVAAPDLLAKEKTEEPPKKKKKPEGALSTVTK